MHGQTPGGHGMQPAPRGPSSLAAGTTVAAANAAIAAAAAAAAAAAVSAGAQTNSGGSGHGQTLSNSSSSSGETPFVSRKPTPLRPQLSHIASASRQPSDNSLVSTHYSPTEVSNWDEHRVAAWIAEIGFAEYSVSFVENRITGAVLRELNYTALRDIGVRIVGDRARILQAIKRQLFAKLTSPLQTTANASLSPPIPSAHASHQPPLSASASTLSRQQQYSPNISSQMRTNYAGNYSNSSTPMSSQHYPPPTPLSAPLTQINSHRPHTHSSQQPSSQNNYNFSNASQSHPEPSHLSTNESVPTIPRPKRTGSLSHDLGLRRNNANLHSQQSNMSQLSAGSNGSLGIPLPVSTTNSNQSSAQPTSAQEILSAGPSETDSVGSSRFDADDRYNSSNRYANSNRYSPNPQYSSAQNDLWQDYGSSASRSAAASRQDAQAPSANVWNTSALSNALRDQYKSDSGGNAASDTRGVSRSRKNSYSDGMPGSRLNNANHDPYNQQQQQQYYDQPSSSQSPGLVSAGLIITPRSSSMKNNEGNEVGLHDHDDDDRATNSFMYSSPASPRLQQQQQQLQSASSQPSIQAPVRGTSHMYQQSSSELRRKQLGSTGQLSSQQQQQQQQSDTRREQEKDIMDIRGVRENCIRVHGLRNQIHIIKVFGLNDPRIIRDKIMNKFNVDPRDRALYGLFIIDESSSNRDGLLSLNDEQLLHVCKSDNEHRGQIFLRRVTKDALTGEIGATGTGETARSSSKLAKFFGEPAPPNSLGGSQNTSSGSAVATAASVAAGVIGAPSQSTGSRKPAAAKLSVRTRNAEQSTVPGPARSTSLAQQTGTKKKPSPSGLWSASTSRTPLTGALSSKVPLRSGGPISGSKSGDGGRMPIPSVANSSGRPFSTSSRRKSKPRVSLFAERPSDEMIVDQLEHFFPGLRNSVGSAESTEDHGTIPKIRNIAQAAIETKRISNRASLFMSRQQIGRKGSTLGLKGMMDDSPMSMRDSAGPKSASAWSSGSETNLRDRTDMRTQSTNYQPHPLRYQDRDESFGSSSSSIRDSSRDYSRTTSYQDGSSSRYGMASSTSNQRLGSQSSLRQKNMSSYPPESPDPPSSPRDGQPNQRRDDNSEFIPLSEIESAWIDQARLAKTNEEALNSFMATADRLSMTSRTFSDDASNTESTDVSTSTAVPSLQENGSTMRPTSSQTSPQHQSSGSSQQNYGVRSSVAALRWDAPSGSQARSSVVRQSILFSKASPASTKRDSTASAGRSIDGETTAQGTLPLSATEKGLGSAASGSAADLQKSSGMAAEASLGQAQQVSVRWEQGPLIGQGAFGRVFHALNLDTGEIMAVKQVVLGDDSNPLKAKQEDSLRREIELLKDLDHANIVKYLGFEITDKCFNVFLEYVSGGSISGCLLKVGQFDDIIAQNFTAQILCGMEYLHSKKIVHRDIKGANVLVNNEGVAKISDFGISKKNEYMAYQRMTRMSMQGSIYWMAPEVARAKGYSAKVDIWSLGCLVLEMLTGNHPWHSVRGNVIYLLGTGKAPPLPDDLSPLARDFLTAVLTVDPERRPTATELLEHPYADVDPESVDFNAWFKAALIMKAANGGTMMSVDEDDEEDDYDDDDYDDDDYEDDDEDVEEEEEDGLYSPSEEIQSHQL